MSHVIKTGHWLYDGQASGVVQIVTEKVGPPEAEDEPPCDQNGNTFYVVYSMADGGKSQSWYFASADEAVREAEAKIPQIAWDSN